MYRIPVTNVLPRNWVQRRCIRSRVIAATSDLIHLPLPHPTPFRLHPRPQESIICADPASGAPLRTYYTLHHEAVLVNLLETVLYHAYAAEALGDDALLGLVDYAVRQVNRLIMSTHARNSLRGDEAARRRLESSADPAMAAFAAAAAARGAAVEADDAAAALPAATGAGTAAAAADDPSRPSLAAAAAIARVSADPAAASAAQLAAWCRDIGFNIGCACVGILRFLSDHLPKLPLSVMARVLDHHDLPLAMVPLLENPPWVRKVKRTVAAAAAAPAAAPAAAATSAAAAGGAKPGAPSAGVSSTALVPAGSAPAASAAVPAPVAAASPAGPASARAAPAADGQLAQPAAAGSSSSSGSSKTVTVWQKFVDRKWVDVPSSDLLKLTPLEGQPWLTLYNLLLEPECRRRYEMHSHRKGTLLRARRYLNEILLDQLPPLAEVQRCMDELAVLAAPDVNAAQSARTALLLEPVVALQAEVEGEALRHPAVLAAAAAAAGGAGESQATRESASAAASAAASAGASSSSLFLTQGEADGASAAGAEGGGKPGPAAVGSWEAVAAVVARHLYGPAASAAGTAVKAGGRPGGKAASSRGGGGGSGVPGLPPPADMRSLAALYTDDAYLEELLGSLGGEGPPRCARCGGEAAKRCGRCGNAWYCGRDCQLADWREGHKALCDLVSGAGASAASATGAAGAAAGQQPASAGAPAARVTRPLISEV